MFFNGKVKKKKKKSSSLVLTLKKSLHVLSHILQCKPEELKLNSIKNKQKAVHKKILSRKKGTSTGRITELD